MKKVFIEIDDKFGTVLSITAIGTDMNTSNATVAAVDLSNCDRIVIDETGKPEIYKNVLK